MKKLVCWVLLAVMLIACLPLEGLALSYEAGPHEHIWSEWFDDPGSCEDPGVSVRDCEYPGCWEYQEKQLPPLGHDWHTTSKVKEPTCTETGWEVVVCKRCGKTERREIPALGHDFKAGKYTKDPTCTERGAREYVCKRCGYTKEYKVDALGHDWGEWKVMVEPLPGIPGYEERECQRCHITEQRDLFADADQSALKFSLWTEKTYYTKDEGILFEFSVENNGNSKLSNNFTPYRIETEPDDPEIEKYMVDAAGYAIKDLDIGESFPYSYQYTAGFLPVGKVTFSSYAFGIDEDGNEVVSNEETVVVYITDEEESEYALYLEGRERTGNPYFKKTDAYIYYDFDLTNLSDGQVTDLHMHTYFKSGLMDDAWIMDEPAGWWPGMKESLKANETTSYYAFSDPKVCELGQQDIICYVYGYDENGNEVRSNEVTITFFIVDEDDDTKHSAMHLDFYEVSGNPYFHFYDINIETNVIIENTGDTKIPDLVLTLTRKSTGTEYSFKISENGDNLAWYEGKSLSETYYISWLDIGENPFTCIARGIDEYGNEVYSNECEIILYLLDEEEEKKEASLHLDADTVDSIYNFHENDWVEYALQLENTGNTPISDISVKIECADETDDFWEIPEGLLNFNQESWDNTGIWSANGGLCNVIHFKDGLQTVYLQARGVDEDGHFVYSNVVEIPLYEIPDDEENEPQYKIELSVYDVNGKPEYYTDDTIDFWWFVANYSDEDLRNLKVVWSGDWPMALGTCAENIDPLSINYGTDFFYTVTPLDALQDHLTFTFHATAYTEDGVPVDSEDVEVTVQIAQDPLEEPDPAPNGLIVRKYRANAPANGEYYQEGETIKYAIVVSNPTEDDISVYEVADELYGMDYEYTQLNADTIYLESKTSITLPYEYKVTYDDCLVGMIVNSAHATIYDENEGYISFYSDNVETPTNERNAMDFDFVLDKYVTNAPDNGVYFTEGETIHYEISATNNSYISDFRSRLVTDILNGGTPIMLDGNAYIKPFTTDYYSLDYTVTKEDCDKGLIINEAMSEVTAEQPGDIVIQDVDYVSIGVETGYDIPDPNVNVVKSVGNAPQFYSYYTEGESILYEISFTNNTGMDMLNVKVYDPVYGFMPIATYGIVKDGESVYTSFMLDVTHDLAEAEHIINQAFIEWERPDMTDHIIANYSNVIITDTGVPEPTPGLLPPIVTKIAANSPMDGAFVPGETIHYLIRVQNPNDVPLSMADLYDDLTGGVNYFEQIAFIGDLAPFADEYFMYDYKVKTDDTMNTSFITNKAVLYYEMDGVTQVANSNAVIVEIKDDFPIEEITDHPYIVKFEKDGPDNGVFYVPGEYIAYDILLVNPTNEDWFFAEVYDVLSDPSDQTIGTRNVLMKNSYELFTFYYQVTDDDADIYGIVDNYAWTRVTDKWDGIFEYASNNVRVKAGRNPVTSIVDGPACVPEMIAVGAGAGILETTYCAEHHEIEASVGQAILDAKSDSEKLAAYQAAEKAWMEALEKEYGETAGDAAKAEKEVFVAHLNTFAETLKALGANDAEIAEAKMNMIRERVTELCFENKYGQEARIDCTYSGDAFAMNSMEPEKCEMIVEGAGSESNIVRVNMCAYHTAASDMLLKALKYAANDADLENAQIKEKRFWTSELANLYKKLAKADKENSALYERDLACFNSLVDQREKQLSAVYPDDWQVVNEMVTRMVIERVMLLDKYLK